MFSEIQRHHRAMVQQPPRCTCRGLPPLVQEFVHRAAYGQELDENMAFKVLLNPRALGEGSRGLPDIWPTATLNF